MSAIFRVSKGARRDPVVDAWLKEGHPELCKIRERGSPRCGSVAKMCWS